MGLAAAAVLALSLQGTSHLPDSSFADAATRDLIRRAAERHRAQDSAVTDYRALLRYRLSFSLGRRRWARIEQRLARDPANFARCAHLQIAARKPVPG